MKISKVFLGGVIICSLLLSCKTDDPEYFDRIQINDILYKIETAFSRQDINTIMQFVHVDYKHNGMVKWQLRELWLNRMAQFLLIDFQDVQIELNGNHATVSFRLKLMSSDATEYYDEPADHGDISFFYFDQSRWQIYGNQENE